MPYSTWLVAISSVVHAIVAPAEPAEAWMLLMTGGVVSATKLAVTDLFVLITTTSGLVCPLASPDQPTKAEPGAGVALTWTVWPHT